MPLVLQTLSTALMLPSLCNCLGCPTCRYNRTFNFTTSLYIDGMPQSSDHPWLAQPLHRRSPSPQLQLQHVWDEGSFPSFRSTSAVDAVTVCGAQGDGRTDDHAALQKCVDEHDIVLLPKGFYRLSRTLVLSRDGGAIVGVGRTKSVLMATSAGMQAGPLLRVSGRGFVVFQVEYVTLWQIPDVWLLDWQASTGFWRQAHGYRTCDLFSETPPPKVGPSCAGYPKRLAAQSVQLDRALSVISGGGRFYAFYVEDWHYQGPNYRHLSINGSSDGVNIYHINPDCVSTCCYC
eukprot:COSAG02_NODE_1893_length_10476_cov_3.336224_2_plen_290_part_00